jgi:hypothetical protein
MPTTLEEIVIPIPQSSSSAQMKMPAQEGSHYLTGHHTDSGTSSTALYSGTGFVVDEELEYEIDQNLPQDTMLNQGMFGFS